MVFKLEGKEETTARNVLNLTLIHQVKFSLHTYEFSRRLTYTFFYVCRCEAKANMSVIKRFIFILYRINICYKNNSTIPSSQELNY